MCGKEMCSEVVQEVSVCEGSLGERCVMEVVLEASMCVREAHRCVREEENVYYRGHFKVR